MGFFSKSSSNESSQIVTNFLKNSHPSLNFTEKIPGIFNSHYEGYAIDPNREEFLFTDKNSAKVYKFDDIRRWSIQVIPNPVCDYPEITFYVSDIEKPSWTFTLPQKGKLSKQERVNWHGEILQQVVNEGKFKDLTS